MTKQSAINQLETIIGKLSTLGYRIDCNHELGDAANIVVRVREMVQAGTYTVRKPIKKKK